MVVHGRITRHFRPRLPTTKWFKRSVETSSWIPYTARSGLSDTWTKPARGGATMTRQDIGQVPSSRENDPISTETWGDSAWPRRHPGKANPLLQRTSTNIPRGMSGIQRNLCVPSCCKQSSGCMGPTRDGLHGSGHRRAGRPSPRKCRPPPDRAIAAQAGRGGAVGQEKRLRQLNCCRGLLLHQNSLEHKAQARHRGRGADRGRRLRRYLIAPGDRCAAGCHTRQ